MENKQNKETTSLRPAWRRVAALLAAIVFAFAYFQANAGLRWGTYWHPDELPVSRWTRQMDGQGYISDRVYPGGWFVLAAPKARLDRFLRRTAERWDRHVEQDGAVSAARPETRPATPPGTPTKRQASRIQTGREFNAFLLAATALLIFVLARELGAHPAAATAGALLFACLPAPLEHAHYCETDGIVGFSLALAAWPALRAIRFGSARWALTAAFAAGFALSCKYTLAPVLLGPPALAWALSRGRPARRGRFFALLALGGLIAFAAGFVAGTPALRLAPSFFLGNVARLSAAAQAGGGLLSGSTGAVRRVLFLVSSHGLGENGAFALALFALGAACWAARDLRRYWPVVPLFLAAYVLNAALVLPWVRNQESLPMIPGLCLGAALALDRAGRALRLRGRAAAAAAAVFALTAAAFVQASARGSRILSCFQSRDTRAECREWLAGSATADVRIALDRYVAQTLRGTPCQGESRSHMAESWPEWAEDPDVASGRIRYALRNASFGGRGIRTTEDLENEAAFLADCPLLRAWSLAPGAVRTLVFAQPDVELRALPGPGTGGEDVPVALDRPLLFAPGPRPFYDAVGMAVGPVRAVHIAGQRHTVHPASDERRRWAVALALDGPPRGDIDWNGLFRPRRLALSAGGAAVFELDAGALRRAARRAVRPSARVRLRNGDDQATRCVAFLTADPAEVARALRRAGEPGAALRFLRSAGDLPAAARVEAFLAARAAGEPADPAWEEAARAALAAADGRIGSVGGAPLAALRDFAGLAVDAEALGADRRPPVFLPAGTWEVRFRASGDPPDGLFFEGQAGPAAEETGEDGLLRLAATVRTDRPGVLRLAPGAGRLLELHMRWNVDEQLDRALAEIRAALGEPEAAR